MTTNQAVTKIQRLLRDENQGVLAIFALALAIQDVFFTTDITWKTVCKDIQYGVIFLFAIEYFASLYLSDKKLKYLFTTRRLLDLAIIVLCLLSLLPSVSDALVHSTAIHFLRLTPILFFGYRGTRELLIDDNVSEISGGCGEIGFHRLEVDADKNVSFIDLSKEEFVAWMSNPERVGSYCADFDDSGLMAESLATPSMPATFIRSSLAKTSYPRISRLGSTFVFSGSLPVLTEHPAWNFHIEPVPFLFVCTAQSLLIVSADHHSIVHTACQMLASEDFVSGQPLHARLTLGMFKLLLTRYEDIATRLEEELRGWEMLPLDRPRDSSYLKVYHLQQSLAGLKSDLWRLRYIFDKLENGKVKLPFDCPEFNSIYNLFSDTCDYTAEAFNQLYDSTSSGLELRMNLISFQMNRFMGLLAVATAIAIIPTTLGGFLGMNIEGINFPVTLGNVCFWAAMLVALVLYFMKTRGWLRF